MQKPHHRSYYLYFDRIRTVRIKRKMDKGYKLISAFSGLTRPEVNANSMHYHFEILKQILNLCELTNGSSFAKIAFQPSMDSAFSSSVTPRKDPRTSWKGGKGIMFRRSINQILEESKND